MGKAVACQLAAKGANIVIVARTVQKLQGAIEDIKRSAVDPSKQKFHFISADLTSALECERVIQEVTQWNDGRAPDVVCQEIEMYNGSRQSKTAGSSPAADVKIHTVFPMGILTSGFDKEEQLKPQLTKQLEEADKPQTPEEVARISIEALERGEYLITTMFVGHIMKASALGGSPRNSIIRDTLTSWLTSLAFLQVIPDLRKKAWNWGVKYGIPSSDGK
ncbi:hypothetical protein ATERTT37_001784 [Aspergillus terreus]